MNDPKTNDINAINIPIFKYLATLCAVSLSCDFIINIVEYKNNKTAIAITNRYDIPNIW